jgi:uncharacterized protein involved in exopolysaccharide biosynthesis
MSPPNLNQLPVNSRINDNDLLFLWGVVWKNKFRILLITASVVLVSIIYTLFQINIYRAEAVLAPAGTRQSGSSLASQLGGAASLVGINIQGATLASDPINAALAVMNSREFIVRFIHEHDILIPLFAGKWNQAEGVSEIDSDVYDVETKEWKLETGAPTDLQAYRKFTSILNVLPPDVRTGLVRVSIDWHDPVLSSQWVNLLVSDINRDIKVRDVKEATNAIEYLQGQLESTQLVEMQRVFYQLIESQTRTIMLADVRDEYVFLIIDRAVIPDQPIAPRRTLIVLIGAMFGLLLAVSIVILQQYLVADEQSFENSGS